MKCKVCGETAEPNFELCWNCSSPLDLTEQRAKVLQLKATKSEMNCVRCQYPMRYAGLKKFHEGGPAWGFWLGDLGELFTKRELMDVYICPQCGKLELFLDGVGDEFRPDKSNKSAS